MRWFKDAIDMFVYTEDEDWNEHTEEYNLAKEIEILKEKYDSILLDIKRLEEENIEQTNALYELSNSLDSRIDIIYNELKGINGDGI